MEVRMNRILREIRIGDAALLYNKQTAAVALF
jgi:hypothetical protein